MATLKWFPVLELYYVVDTELGVEAVARRSSDVLKAAKIRGRILISKLGRSPCHQASRTCQSERQASG